MLRNKIQLAWKPGAWDLCVSGIDGLALSNLTGFVHLYGIDGLAVSSLIRCVHLYGIDGLAVPSLIRCVHLYGIDGLAVSTPGVDGFVHYNRILLLSTLPCFNSYHLPLCAFFFNRKMAEATVTFL